MKLIAGRSRLEIHDLLLSRLREARRDFDDQRTEKEGAVFALKAVTDFLGNFEEVDSESLSVPFKLLIAALEDADRGIPSRFLSVKKLPGRVPAPTELVALHACAVFLSERLVKYGGMKAPDADLLIANWLTRFGLKPLRQRTDREKGNKIDARLVKSWRERIQQDVGNHQAISVSFRDMTQQVPPPAQDVTAGEVKAEAMDVLKGFMAKIHIPNQNPTNHPS